MDSNYIMEKKEVNELQALRDRIALSRPNDAKLYFVTRILREGLQRRKAIADKFLYKVYQIDIDDEIRSYLYTSTITQLDKTLKKDVYLFDYDPISDDTESLFTYSIKGRALAFSDVVINQLTRIPPKVQSIEGIVSEDEELWAYCIGFEEEDHNWVYTFRKILGNKIAIDEKNNPNKNVVKRAINTLFNTESKKLQLLKGEVVALDKQVDCVYFDETFYILKKTPFEQIVGIQEEFKEIALEVVKDLGSTNLIDGINIIEDKVKNSTAIHKKLAKIAKNEGIKRLDTKAISNMKRVAKKYGERNIIQNGRIVLNEEKDIDALLKMLGDYYKTGDVSGKSYGTYSGREIQANKGN